MSDRILLSIDPGGTSGFVRAVWNEDTDDVTVMWVDEWSDDNRLHMLLGFGLLTGVHTCIIESYSIWPGAFSANVGGALDAPKVIGKIEWICNERNILREAYTAQKIEIVYQTPSMAKQWWPNKRIKPYAARLSSAHTRDALRHLLTYIERNNDQRQLKIHFDTQRMG